MLGNFFAGVLFVLSFVVLLTSRTFRRNPTARLAAMLVMALHQVAVVINAFFFNLPGSGADTYVFHTAAAELAHRSLSIRDFGVGVPDFTAALSLFYRVLGTKSYFLGMELAVFSVCLSCLILCELVKLLTLERYTTVILLVWGCLPSHVVYTGTLLREGWQGFFMIWSVYWALRLLRNTGDRSALVSFPVACIGLGSLHKGLAFFALILFGVTAWLASRKLELKVRGGTHPLSLVIKLAVILLAAVVISGKLNLGQNSSEVVSQTEHGKLLTYAEHYRERSVHSRASYGVKLDASSFTGLIKTVPLIIVLYMFAPFPWQVGKLIDVVACCEGILRMVLIVASIKAWQTSDGRRRYEYALLLLSFFCLEFLWAMGTVDWGPACRHRTVAWFIIVVLGVPSLLRKVRLPAGLGRILDPPRSRRRSGRLKGR